MNIAGPDLVKLSREGKRQRGKEEEEERGWLVEDSCCRSGSQAGTALSWRSPFLEDVSAGQEQEPAGVVVAPHTGPFTAASAEGTHCSVLASSLTGDSRGPLMASLGDFAFSST